VFEPLETPRLLLRAPRPDDLDALVERRNHAAVAEYQDWSLPWPRERAAAILDEVIEQGGPATDHWWMLSVEALDDGRVVGDVSVKLEWDGRAAEIGYTFASEEWGNGFAVEAAGALVDWLWSDPRITRISATLHPDNRRSARVVERLGFVSEGHTRLSWWVGDENSDDLIYGQVRADRDAWLARPTGRPHEVGLAEVTWEQIRPVVMLRTHKSQERFVSPNAISFAEALHPEPFDGKPVTPWYRAIEADGEIVGFVMLDTAEGTDGHPYLWRLMIDRFHQRRGIGWRVLDLVVEQCREWGAEAVEVSWMPGVGSPEPMYLAYGFQPTGRIIDGETEGRFALTLE